MRVACVSGFAWEPKGTARSRAFPLAAELVKKGELEVARGVYHLDTGRLELLGKTAAVVAK